MTAIRKIGIVGVGPRGGYSLEKLIIELVKQNSLLNIHISLFESTGNFGNGQVYDIDQNSSNWVNITERILELDQREAIDIDSLKIASFASYHDWADKDFNTLSDDTIDTYPPRAQVGEYLSQRFQSLAKPLIQSNIIALHKEQVKEVKLLNNDKIQISTNAKAYEEFDEVLLTIGHQSTELPQQIADWEKFAGDKKNINLFKSPYPVADYLHHKNLNNESIIGIRGFGLVMIDVVRAIAEKFGEFITLDEQTRSSTYQIEQKGIPTIVPFSLDGLPPSPKPLNAQIDKWFKPTEASILKFEKHIGDKKNQTAAESPRFLIEAFAPIAAGIYLDLPDIINPQNLSASAIIKLIEKWLEDQSFENSLIISRKQPAKESMKSFVEMATGEAAISLDYCIGQVWRYCQPSIYKKLSFNECSDNVFAEIIALDESTKRYSYGPPVESIQQLLALEEAGVLNLDMANDPNIKLTAEGWQFNLADQSITANFMIDSVLDAPQIKVVNSPIVENMLVDNLIKIVHNDLGVETNENGY